MRRLIFIFISIFLAIDVYTQEISLYQQFNGNYDYIAIGNTLNPGENNLNTFCQILPASQANLEIPPNTTIKEAYLFWAGSGEGDLEVTLNDFPISAETVYNVTYNDPNNGLLTYFSCATKITDFVISEGNTNYELTNLDISEVLTSNPGYCANRTNFAGWSIYVIYEDNTLPLNQINLFLGLEIINRTIQEKTIILNNLNVLDTQNAKIGFLAWEGDNALNLGETLSINNTIISNPPLNLANNAFNGTNTFTNSTTFYNADLDVYPIQNHIEIGDTTASIKLTTQADLILINNIITVLNSQLPDATININSQYLECSSREIQIDYTVYNTNSTDVLPANTLIACYANNILVGNSETQNEIAINGFENGTITISIPDAIPDDFILTLVVDDDGTGNGTINETNENNNSSNQNISLLTIPPIQQLPNILACDINFNTAFFDLTTAITNLNYNHISEISFFENLEDLTSNNNAIQTPSYFQNSSSPQTIYIRKELPICYEIYQFQILTENCPPFIPQGFSPNNDGFNDWFNIQGLYNIFEKHELLIYNRYGTLIFKGNNEKRWEGKANHGLNNKGKILPVGTYFYVLNLNDPNYQIITGWVYLNK